MLDSIKKGLRKTTFNFVIPITAFYFALFHGKAVAGDPLTVSDPLADVPVSNIPVSLGIFIGFILPFVLIFSFFKLSAKMKRSNTEYRTAQLMQGVPPKKVADSPGYQNYKGSWKFIIGGMLMFMLSFLSKIDIPAVMTALTITMTSWTINSLITTFKLPPKASEL